MSCLLDVCHRLTMPLGTPTISAGTLAVPPGTQPSALPCDFCLDAAGPLQALHSDLPQPRGKSWGCRLESSLAEVSGKWVTSARPVWVPGCSTHHIPRAAAVSESTVCTPGSFFYLSSFRVCSTSFGFLSTRWMFQGHGTHSPNAWFHVHCCSMRGEVLCKRTRPSCSLEQESKHSSQGQEERRET